MMVRAAVFVLTLCGLAYAQQPATSPPSLPKGVKLVPNIEYANPQNHSLLMDLYLPEKADAGAPLPVILYVHGGGWSAGDRHDRTAVALVPHGYAVACIEYRLSQVAQFPAQIEDCKAAVRWLRAKAKLYNLDPLRIGAWGPSAGGHLVALLGTTGDVKELEGTEGNLDYSSRVQAVCDWFGPTDFSVIGDQAKHLPVPSAIQHDAADSPEAKLLGGPIAEQKEKVRQANPISYITKDDPPFLIMHGDRDGLVPLAQSEMLRDALQKAGVQATLEVIPGAGHGFGGAKIMQAVQDFFDTQFKRPTTTQPSGR
jgi:acetyl esterase/lipase